ncbi:MAG: multidrug effflux MFS transporter [Gammaproteobacteria bacterium]|nr:multidrug effflux MFS transporter [Gammaproteobacteria bacterium]
MKTITRLACLLNAIAMACYVIADLSHFITTAAPLRSIMTIIIVMMTFYISFGLAIPNILSAALLHYKTMVGSAGAILGLSYYIVVGVVLFGMGSITIAPVKAMALYFFVLAIIMIAATYLLRDIEEEANK